MAEDSIRYRIVSEDDLEAVHEGHGFGIRNWHHYYFHPAVQPSFLAVMETAEGKVTGTEGFTAYRMRLDNEVILTHRSELTYINPDYRGHGAFGHLVETCHFPAEEAGSYCCWGATTALKPFGRAGFHSYTQFRTYWTLPLYPGRLWRKYALGKLELTRNPVKLARRIKQKDMETGRNLIGLLGSLKSLKAPRGRKGWRNHPFSFSSKRPSSSDWNNLMGKLRKQAGFFCMDHHDAFYDWMGQTPLGKDMRFYAAYADGELKACILLAPKGNSPLVDVLDFAAESLTSLQFLVHHIRSDLKSSGEAVLVFKINSSNVEQKAFSQLLSQVGGKRHIAAGSFVVLPLAHKEEGFYKNLSRWYITDLWLTFSTIPR